MRTFKIRNKLSTGKRFLIIEVLIPTQAIVYDIVVTIIGWTGVAAYIIAYAMLSLGWVRADKINYHALNAVGGVCLVIFSYAAADTPNLFVNFIWILIAGFSITRILKMRR